MSRHVSVHIDKRRADVTLSVVADQFELTVRELRTRTNAHHITGPRYLAMWVLTHRGWSYPRIGKALGGFHHTTVLHGLRQVEQQRKQSVEFREFTSQLLDACRAEDRAAKLKVTDRLTRLQLLEREVADLKARLIPREAVA